MNFLALPLAIAFLMSLLGFNLVQMLSLVVLPFSRKAFRKINRGCANLWWGGAVLISERIYQTKIRFTGDAIPTGENAIVFANHQEMPDILAIMSLAIRKGRLGDMKWFVKNIIKFVPGIGWGMLFLDCVFLKRTWNQDAASILKTFQKFLEPSFHFWLVFFPEGTRIKPRKLAASVLHARRKNLWTPQNVLIPRTKGFTSAVSALRNKMDAAYDVTLGYTTSSGQTIPSLWDLLQGRVLTMHIDVRRFPPSELPLNEEDLIQWLYKRYERKDQLLSQFKRDGYFDAPLVNEPPAQL